MIIPVPIPRTSFRSKRGLGGVPKKKRKKESPSNGKTVDGTWTLWVTSMWTTAGMAFWATSAMAVVKSMEWTFWAFAPVGKSKKSPPRISRRAVKVLPQILINFIPPFSFYGYC
jgi:hypothetical protein